jgi:transcription factor E
MKITTEEVEKVITEVAGPDVIPLVRYLKNKKNISEFKIAEELKEEVNTIRNRLYRLYDANLITFIRKKDKVKGWYIYYWTLNLRHVPYIIKELKRKKVEKLQDRLKREHGSHFFMCKSKCIRLDFEQATDFSFKCPECGSLLDKEENEEKIEEIKKSIMKLEKELAKIS